MLSKDNTQLYSLVLRKSAFLKCYAVQIATESFSEIIESWNHRGWKRPLRSSSPTINLAIPLTIRQFSLYKAVCIFKNLQKQPTFFFLTCLKCTVSPGQRPQRDILASSCGKPGQQFCFFWGQRFHVLFWQCILQKSTVSHLSAWQDHGADSPGAMLRHMENKEESGDSLRAWLH